ncbi:MAG: DUF6786 family protein [Pirellulales bacterium]
MMAAMAHGADLSFNADVKFLQQHVDTVVLGSDAGGPRVAVVPAYQGRVMTSTTGGELQPSFGWINYEHIASKKLTPHINVYGGEERFWLGPEGGQFSIFFPPGAKFELADWQTPAVIDTDTFAVATRSDDAVSFQHAATLKNYSGAEFKVAIERKIELLSQHQIEQALGQPVGGKVKSVGYRSTNLLTNAGENDWHKDSGLLSIWMLGMYKPGARTTVVVPFRAGSEAELGPVVNDAYFGKPPAERLVIGDGVLFFSSDGQFRSKLGLPPQRATELAGSWDADAGVLTIIKYTKPASAAAGYVNSMWELQQQPFAGDVVNAYNDGPPGPGAKPLGPFYELETSSPALALAAGESAEHIQETFHLEGDRGALDQLAQRLLGASLSEIEAALK